MEMSIRTNLTDMKAMCFSCYGKSTSLCILFGRFGYPVFFASGGGNFLKLVIVFLLIHTKFTI